MEPGGGDTFAAIPGPGGAGDGLAEIVAAGGLHNYQLKLHAVYGPVVRFRLPGAETVVSIADPVLLEATAKVDKRPEKLFEFLAPLQESDNLQTLSAEEHTPWRRVLLSVLAGRRSHEAHFGQFVALTCDTADRWADSDGPIALQQHLSELSLRMICDYALGAGADSPEQAGRIVSAFEDVLTDQLARLYQADLPGTEVERSARAQRALTFLRTTVDDVLAAHQDAARQTDGSDLIAALAAAGQPPARIRDTVLMTMLAAHHTTGVAISWTLYLLAQHPEVADRVAEEVADVLGNRPAPDYADLKRLTYLKMVLEESMRLYPPGPYGAREISEDLRVGDYTIPAGTTIFYPIWAVHLNPEYWPQPEVFRPERFSAAESAGRPRLAYIPFGLGPRSCEGAALAMVEAQLVLAVLLRRFRFELAPGHSVVPVERFVLWAADDIRMNLTPRVT
ncbi:cytochrome P450 [Nocardia ninae]|uniref:Cytochrome P450 n=1 Tax=Nocardia ninae NBRC 108245 TaxID=1210091 RepID=A0A511MRH4_9NOCA|nr:cytochrome P450 [Nocardia ninae]GEM42616.1 cytochrome P450 [Nocardia ninae NBRC 108245]